MTHLLDTNVVSRVIRGDRTVVRRLRTMRHDQLAVPAVALAELWAGFVGDANISALVADWTALDLMVLPFQAQDAVCAGEIRAGLWRAGTPIGLLDTLIAGQALARDMTLVTHDTREFARVPGLRLEDREA